mmetsp:Transcript_64033/g.171501  ORF Transcript_64033/g.171501 Transcript_64033/m.171501 type:complete len:156 (+) Transcript_64033:130-597(+)
MLSGSESYTFSKEMDFGPPSYSRTSKEDIGVTAQPQVTQKFGGRLCFGVNLPGTGHIEYIFEIRTSQGDVWKISRRYSEFLDLDSKLRQIFGKPTRPFPPLPKKQLVGSQSEKVVEERQRMLAAYLQAVLDNKILATTSEVKRFIGEDSAPRVCR